ncbi:LPXTG cell wall anchor domain-containing protein [Lacticaseibacillus hegangensis]|uniref:LPXTG cell wall anchor domain-containing protein n=1 Tax=Lacticaseibacillus hegangensis TaxID=2486010 RepID=A0ABW4CYL5_9LACO|nr:LPXTG cell wall anchor domain-containing protein [Lacticaseibacillus hegangensis]
MTLKYKYVLYASMTAAALLTAKAVPVDAASTKLASSKLGVTQDAGQEAVAAIANEQMATNKPASQAEYSGNIAAGEADVEAAKVRVVADQQEVTPENEAVSEAQMELQKATSNQVAAQAAVDGTSVKNAESEVAKAQIALDNVHAHPTQATIDAANGTLATAQSTLSAAYLTQKNADDALKIAQANVLKAQNALEAANASLTKNVDVSNSPSVVAAQKALDQNQQALNKAESDTAAAQAAVTNAQKTVDEANAVLSNAQAALSASSSDTQGNQKTEIFTYNQSNWPDSIPASATSEVVTINSDPNNYKLNWSNVYKYFYQYLNEFHEANGIRTVSVPPLEDPEKSGWSDPDQWTSGKISDMLSEKIGFNGPTDALVGLDGIGNMFFSAQPVKPTHSDQETAYNLLMNWYDETNSIYAGTSEYAGTTSIKYLHRCAVLFAQPKTSFLYSPMNGGVVQYVSYPKETRPEGYPDQTAHPDEYKRIYELISDPSAGKNFVGLTNFTFKYIYTDTAPAKQKDLEAAVAKAQTDKNTADVNLTNAEGKLASAKRGEAELQSKSAVLSKSLDQAIKATVDAASVSGPAAEALRQAVDVAQVKLNAAQADKLSANQAVTEAENKLADTQKQVKYLLDATSSREQSQQVLNEAKAALESAQIEEKNYAANLVSANEALANAQAKLHEAVETISLSNVKLTVDEALLKQAEALLDRIKANTPADVQTSLVDTAGGAGFGLSVHGTGVSLASKSEAKIGRGAGFKMSDHNTGVSLVSKSGAEADREAGFERSVRDTGVSLASKSGVKTDGEASSDKYPETGENVNPAFAVAGLGLLSVLGSIVGYKHRKA